MLKRLYRLELKNREEEIRLLHNRVDHSVCCWLSSVLQQRSALQCRSHSCSSVPTAQTSRYDSLLTCGIHTCQSNTAQETHVHQSTRWWRRYYRLNTGELCHISQSQSPKDTLEWYWPLSLSLYIYIYIYIYMCVCVCVCVCVFMQCWYADACKCTHPVEEQQVSVQRRH